MNIDAILSRLDCKILVHEVVTLSSTAKTMTALLSQLLKTSKFLNANYTNSFRLVISLASYNSLVIEIVSIVK